MKAGGRMLRCPRSTRPGLRLVWADEAALGHAMADLGFSDDTEAIVKGHII